MRIGSGAVLPPMTPPAENASQAPDRAALFKAVAQAELNSLPALQPDAAARLAERAPDVTLAVLGAETALVGAVLQDVVPVMPDPPRTADPRLTGARLAPPEATHASWPVAAAGQSAASAGSDHVTLSTVAGLLQMAPRAPDGRPVDRFMLDMLEALTGEPRSQIRQLPPDARMQAGARYMAGAPLDRPGDSLRLLVRGSMRGSDQKLVDLSFGMTILGQSASPELDADIQVAMQQWAQTKILLDYPGAVADLAGQHVDFQALLDPQGLWPLQSFLMSGLLKFGFARDDEEEPSLPDSESDPARDDGESDASPPQKKVAPPLPDEPTQIPADGGPPIISARRWLELELRYLRRQVRLWMGLPPPMGQTL